MTQNNIYMKTNLEYKAPDSALLEMRFRGIICQSGGREEISGLDGPIGGWDDED